MAALSNLSVKSRLVLMLTAVSLLSVLVVGYLGWSSARGALRESIEGRMTSLRINQAREIENYFDQILKQTATLAEDRMIIDALLQFRTGYEDASTWPILQEWADEVDAYYQDTYLPALSPNVEGTPLFELYRPEQPAASYLQYHYIAASPFPVDQKERLSNADEDSSLYARAHVRFHPPLRNFTTRFGFLDLYLIDVRTGDVIYSVGKRADFATNLLDGPYRESSFAQLFTDIERNPDQGFARLADFRPYRPALARPTAFAGAPIYEGTELIGVLALQLPTGAIDRLVSGDEGWRASGLGERGESLIVGSDLLMRSNARFMMEEDSSEIVETMSRLAMAEPIRERIERFGSTLLLAPVVGDGAQRALDGESGTTTGRGYRGEPVLSSYQPLAIPDLEWALVTEIELSEAFAPILAVRQDILLIGVLVVLMISFGSVLLSRLFVRPIDRLIEAIRRVNQGKSIRPLVIGAQDEFGDLAAAFQEMVVRIQQQNRLVEEKTQENQRLLLSILPAPIAQRLEAGEEVVDRLQQVTVLFMRLLGFSEMAQRQGARLSADALSELITDLDEAAERFDIERIKIMGETYVAAGGLTMAHLDHARRSLDFCVAAMAIVDKYDREHDERLAIQIGVNSGPVIAGVVGAHRMVFELWGETVNISQELQHQAPPNTVLLTQSVYERVHTLFEFEPANPLSYQDEMHPTWRLCLDRGETE